MVKIAPSVLSLDYTRFNEQLTEINKTADWLHFDVMDGHFVPNLSFGPDILKAFARESSLYKDVHLMVSDPQFFAPIFMEAGAENITFHQEAVADFAKQRSLIENIHALGGQAGISIKPKTSVDTLREILPYIDLVLVMSVEPGFGGQKFLDSAYEKVELLAKIRAENNYHYLIEVDGGVNGENAHALTEKGCDVLVAGSYVFKGNIAERIATLR